FSDESYGIALNLDENEIGVVLLTDDTAIKAGDTVYRTERTLDVPVGEGLIGRVINPLGQPLDGKGQVIFSHRYPVERPAPAIMDRAPIASPLQSGIKVIEDRKSTRLNSSHVKISYAVFCLKKKKKTDTQNLHKTYIT